MLSFAQSAKKKPLTTYTYTHGSIWYSLELSTDSTFVYQCSLKLGITTSRGKWKIAGDTLKLSGYETPWTIQKVTHKMEGAVKDKIIVKVVAADNNSIEYGTDVSVKDFEVWINDDCKTKARTNQSGIIAFKDKITRISIDYDEKEVADTASNYYVITLSQYPVFMPANTLMWNKWQISKHEIKPIECGKALNYITLTETSK